jgi:5-methylcytosine-specific restriction endonuclease McrA
MLGMTVETLKMIRTEADHAYKRKWYLEHREERLVHAAVYRENHREVLAAKQLVYGAAHKEQEALYDKEYRITYAPAHKQEKAACGARYYVARRGDPAYQQKHLQCNRQWFKSPNGKAYCAKANHERRALGYLDIKSFHAKCVEFGWHCQICGKELTKDTVTIDHIVPISKGGTNAIENLQPLCERCNSKKGNRSMSAVVGSQYLFE